MNIEVKMGDIAVAQPPSNLAASAVGSCLIIIFYDPGPLIGAMAHAMLSTHSLAAKHQLKDTKYIDPAVDEMIERMLASGAKKGNLEARLVGGANMFPALKSDIGKNNVLSAKKKLEEEGIRLIGECVGGSIGRSVEFSTTTGVVTVKTKF